MATTNAWKYEVIPCKSAEFVTTMLFKLKSNNEDSTKRPHHKTMKTSMNPIWSKSDHISLLSDPSLWDQFQRNLTQSTKHNWVTEIQVCWNEGQNPLKMGDNLNWWKFTGISSLTILPEKLKRVEASYGCVNLSLFKSSFPGVGWGLSWGFFLHWNEWRTFFKKLLKTPFGHISCNLGGNTPR